MDPRLVLLHIHLRRSVILKQSFANHGLRHVSYFGSEACYSIICIHAADTNSIPKYEIDETMMSQPYNIYTWVYLLHHDEDAIDPDGPYDTRSVENGPDQYGEQRLH